MEIKALYDIFRQSSGVNTDSRTIRSGELFFALKGENFDGNSYALKALEAGAVAAVVNDTLEDEDPRLIKVPDSLSTLKELAAYHRQNVLGDKHLPVIGLTGTNGKTTTKELIRSVLSKKFKVTATEGNLNNDIGVPLTLLRLTEKHKYAIVEMGTNHPGEIDYTVNLVKPDVALINNVGYAHLEGFGSLRGVFRAKSEIFNGLNSGGTAVFNHDSEFYGDFLNEQKHFRCCSFSRENSDATCYASDIQIDSRGRAGFVLHNPDGTVPVKLRIVGIHNVANACAAATAAYALGIGLDVIRQGLESYEAYQGRLKVTEKNNVTLIDDTYNASANAVFAAIETMNSMDGYKVLILGDMGELGDQAEELHKEVGARVLNSRIDLFLTVGNLTRLSAEASGGKGSFFESKDELKLWLKDNFDKNRKSAVLIKGSHSMKMHEILDYIKDELC
jgi:UDP-N-acetylmuramoyl-tripeptide--D-alanyl-D-alanine ligase